MSADKTLAVRNQSQIARPDGDGQEINQLVMSGGQVIDQEHRYSIGDEDYIAKPLVCFLDKNDFITIKTGFGENQQTSYVLKVDGKKKIMSLAGVNCNESRFNTKLGPDNRDVCEYEAVGVWMSPTGQVVKEPRTRRIDLKEVERQQTLHKMKAVVKEWESGKWKSGSRVPNSEQPEKVEELKKALIEKLSQGMSTDEAMYSLRAMVLPLSDILQIQANIADMREHLLAITQSKAQSQLGTAMMRNFGGRCVLTTAPGDKLKVHLVNTVKVLPPSNPDAVNVLYGDETVVTASGEEVKVEDMETDETVKEIHDAEIVAGLDEGAVDADFREETITTEEGVVVVAETGEVPFEGEPVSEEAPAFDRETVTKAIIELFAELDYKPADQVRTLTQLTGKGRASALTDDEIASVYAHLQALKENGGKA